MSLVAFCSCNPNFSHVIRKNPNNPENWYKAKSSKFSNRKAFGTFELVSTNGVSEVCAASYLVGSVNKNEAYETREDILHAARTYNTEHLNSSVRKVMASVLKDENDLDVVDKQCMEISSFILPCVDLYKDLEIVDLISYGVEEGVPVLRVFTTSTIKQLVQLCLVMITHSPFKSVERPPLEENLSIVELMKKVGMTELLFEDWLTNVMKQEKQYEPLRNKFHE